MRFGSVCSGIEAASVAWHPLGWRASFLSEIEAFPRAVLKHHYPETPLHGDFTTIKEGEYAPIDLLVGGTPCQSFSVAGLRGGLADDRGNLALEYLRLADRLRPRWLVWENVPGVLSSNGGRDFGSILGGLVELGYGFAYRVLDAQHFGVPQRRRRVFVVGYLGDWRRAAAVLFERHSLQGHSPPRREKGQSAPTIPSRSSAGGDLGTDVDCDGGLIGYGLNGHGSYSESGASLRAEGGDCGGGSEYLIAPAVTSKWAKGSGGPAGDECQNLITHAIQGAATRDNPTSGPDGVGVRSDGVAYTLEARAEVQAVCFSAKDYGADASDIAPTLRAGGHAKSHANAGVMPAIAFGGDLACTLSARHDSSPCADRGMDVVAASSAVRRLTPRECERLQGFPDDYTLIPWRKGFAPDGPRYKALGNSMAVPVMSWLGQRIAAVEALNLSTLGRAA